MRRSLWFFPLVSMLAACAPRAYPADAAPVDDAGMDGGEDRDASATSDGTNATDATDVSPSCVSEDAFAWGRGGIDMLPGSDCLSCHRADASAGSAVFSAAGTVFSSPSCRDGVRGAVVILRDSNGREERLTTSELGNFATTTALVPPLSARVAYNGREIAMRTDVDHGSCNSCHRVDRPLGLLPAP